ncbi:hypothetical protein BC829DRAFT_11899 [Chytridium lagenaria]|nr:hypothetical protein BC829DRAFT_11899 [Chytridium lagenaria]
MESAQSPFTQERGFGKSFFWRDKKRPCNSARPSFWDALLPLLSGAETALPTLSRLRQSSRAPSSTQQLAKRVLSVWTLVVREHGSIRPILSTLLQEPYHDNPEMLEALTKELEADPQSITLELLSRSIVILLEARQHVHSILSTIIDRGKLT